MSARKEQHGEDAGTVNAQHLFDLRELFQSLSSISTVTSLQELLPQLAQLVAHSVGARSCSVFLFDREATKITNHLRWGYQAIEQPLLQRARVDLDPHDNPALSEVITTRQPMLRVPGVTPDRFLPTNTAWREAYWAGDMVVPLVWDDQVEGIAMVIPRKDAEPFSNLQLEIVQGVARQAAGIIHHLRTVDAEREARQQTEMVLRLSRIFNTAGTIEQVYDSLAEAVQSLIGTDAVSVVVKELSVFDNDSASTRRITSLGMTQAEQDVRNLILQERSTLDSSVDRIAASANGPVLIRDIRTKVDDPRLKQDYADNGVDDLLSIPIKLSGELHAVLYAWSRHRKIEASDEALGIAGVLASHAAASVERLLLIQAERRRRERSEILADVNQRFAEVDDPQSLIQIAAGAVRRALQADHVTVAISQSSNGSLHTFLSDGTDPGILATLLTSQACRILVPDAETAGTAHARVVPDEELDGWKKLLCPEQATTAGVNGRFHMIAVPLQLAGSITGMLHAWFTGVPAPVSQPDLETADSIVAALAVASEREHLQARERQEWNRAEMLLSFADALNRSVDMPTVSSSILQTVRQHLPGIHAAIAQRDSDLTGGWSVEPGVMFATGRAFHDLLDVTVNERSTRTGYIDGVSILTVPLVAGDDLAGVLVLARTGADAITDADHDVSTNLAPQAADAIQRARLFAVSERTVAELALLHEVGRTIAQRRRLPDIFDYIFSEIQNLVDFSVGLLALNTHDQGHLEIVAIWGNAPDEAVGERIPVEASIMGMVYRNHEPVAVDDVQAHPIAFGVDRAVWRSLICVPLMTGSRAIGALLVGHPERSRFTPEDVRLASLLASQAGAAIYQARESDRQRELYRAGVEALAAAVDAKDSYTHSHSRQVAELSRRTAEALGLDPEEMERIELAGLLHDVGKIGIPDHILTKPGRLDPQERLLMIGHAALGARIVAAHPALAELSELVLHHHEWHNGSGYPDGLRGDEVPIGSAIISVADAFDSMTTYRPYRSSLSFEATCDELRKWSGVQFHPRVIEAFLSTIEESDSEAPEVTGPSVDMRPIRAVDIIAPRVLSQVATEIVGLTDIYPFLDRLQQITRDELKYDEVHIFLTEDKDSDLILAASTIHSEMVGRLRISGGNVLAAEAARTRTLINSGDILEDPRAGFIDLDSRSGLEVPLIVDGALIGVLGAASADSHRFEARDEALMDAIARQIAPMVMVARLHDYTRRTASIDGLTGVMNHRAFYLRLEEMLANLEDWDNDLHLLIVDVVGLKAVNDVYGHLAGDRALLAVANALKSRVRSEDEVARYGGDEFVVIVRGTPRGGLKELAARITAPVSFSLDDGYSMTIRLRCGVATAHSSTERATELVARADAGLYIDIQPTERDRDES